MWELDYKESWSLKNWCFWTVVLEKTLESPLDCKEIQPVHPKENQSWIFIGRTDAEAETPYIGHLMQTDLLKTLKRPWDWERFKSGGEEDNRGWGDWMASPTQWTWVWVNSSIWWWTGRPGSPWGCKESDRTGLSNWTDGTTESITISICPREVYNLIGKWWAFHFVECAYIHLFKD